MTDSGEISPERILNFRAGRRARGRPLDEYLQSRYISLSIQYVRDRIEAGDVRLNGRIPSPSDRVVTGDALQLLLPADPRGPLVADPDPIQILHEDDDFLVLDKQAGLVFQPSHRHIGGSLVNRVVFHLNREPFVLHRLDMDTSGVVLFAKRRELVPGISQQFQNRVIKKEYRALVEGIPSSPRFTVEAPVARDPEIKNRRRIHSSGKAATTHFECLQTFGRSVSLLTARPVTGRTHQIRLHLAHAGHPVLADTFYGSPTPLIDRQALHALRISFTHPLTENSLSFEAPLAADFQRALSTLERTP